jgi:hypothetical protein
MAEIEQWLIVVNNPLATLAIIILTGMRGYWVWGWIYRERETQLQTLLDRALAETVAWQKVAVDGTKLAESLIKDR